jgi:hypothetical protein
METKKDKIKFHKNWGDVNPVIKIKDNNKRYDRASCKQELYKNLKDLEQLEEEDYDVTE